MLNTFQGLNILEFTEKFSTDDKFKEYLSELKWENGYQCGNCGHGFYRNGKFVGSRVCSKCNYLESATARTLFHRVKFPLRKAFHIIYSMTCTKKGISNYELSRQLSLRQKTCWAFQRKVHEGMRSSDKDQLNGTIEVDEFFVGGYEEGKTGRGNEKKKQVVMAIQVDGFGIHHCYAQVIPCTNSDELGAFLHSKIASEAIVKTDKWTRYAPSKKAFPNLKKEKSDHGKTHQLMHGQIMMFKAWLRGIHHHCLHLQRYLDGFCYRFNRLKYPDNMFNNLIKTMIAKGPIYLQKSWVV